MVPGKMWVFMLIFLSKRYLEKPKDLILLKCFNPQWDVYDKLVERQEFNKYVQLCRYVNKRHLQGIVIVTRINDCSVIGSRVYRLS